MILVFNILYTIHGMLSLIVSDMKLKIPVGEQKKKKSARDEACNSSNFVWLEQRRVSWKPALLLEDKCQLISYGYHVSEKKRVMKSTDTTRWQLLWNVLLGTNINPNAVITIVIPISQPFSHIWVVFSFRIIELYGGWRTSTAFYILL